MDDIDLDALADEALGISSGPQADVSQAVDLDLDLDALADEALSLGSNDSVPELTWQNPDPVYSLPSMQEKTQPNELAGELDLDALANEALGLDKEKGPLSKAFDWYANRANTVGEGIVETAEDFTREVSPLFKALKPIATPLSTVVKGATTYLDTMNRIAGTAVGTGLDAFINPTMNPNIFSFAQEARKRRDERREMGMDPEYPWMEKHIPIRLIEDVTYPLGESLMKNLAKGLRLTGNETAEDIAYVVEGFAPGAGMAAGIMTPLPMLTFGKLTQAGKALQKTGAKELLGGTAQQMARGQRGAIGMDLVGFGMPTKEIFNVGGKQFAKMYDRVNEAVIKSELANSSFNPVRPLAKLLSKTQHEGVNRFVEDFNMAKNAVQYDKGSIIKNMGLKAQSLGVDLSDEGIKKSFNKYLDNPSLFSKTKEAEKYEALFKYLDDNLKKEVELTRQSNIPVRNKKFESTGDPAIDSLMSERYVPRGTTLTKRQELLAKKTLSEFEDAEEFVTQMMDQKHGANKSISGFQKKRSNYSRESMNNYMSEKYGIDDFFHDDAIGAYADKIAELRNARIEKEFAENLIKTFGGTEVDYLRKIKEARAKVSEQRAMGIIPSNDDVYLASLNARGLQRLKQLPEKTRNRLRAIGVLSEDVKDAGNLRLPEEIASYITDVIHRPTLSGVERGLFAYQNAMKGFMFFTPGYHIRNFFESFGRGLSYDAGVMAHAKASTAMFRNKGPYKKYYDEFKRLGSDLTKTSYLDPSGSPVYGRTLKVPRGMVNDLDSTRIMMSSFKEIFAKGKWKEFLTDLRAGKANVRDNPLFSFATEIGVNGENLSKLATFSKFREQGFSATEAMRKVNRIFPDYQISREGLRRSSIALPFINYFTKNAETTLKILAEAPKGGAILGPGGAMQRAVENWAAFDPERTYRVKDLIGGTADESLFLGIAPGADALERHPDYIRDVISWLNEGLPEGDIISWRLPSNLHALKQMSPENIANTQGPIAGAFVSLLGKDPFTGKPLIGRGTSAEWPEKISRAMESLASPMNFGTALPVVQKLLTEQFGPWKDRLLNAGLPDGAVELIFGKDTERARDRASRALVRMKSLWLGSGTEIDRRSLFIAQARMKDAEQYMKDINILVKTDRRDPKELEAAQKVLEKAYDDVNLLMQTVSEYQAIVDKVGGFAPPMIYEEYDPEPGEVVPVPEEYEAGPDDDSDLLELLESEGITVDDLYGRDLEELQQDRSPDSLSLIANPLPQNELFRRGSDLTRTQLLAEEEAPIDNQEEELQRRYMETGRFFDEDLLRPEEAIQVDPEILRQQQEAFEMPRRGPADSAEADMAESAEADAFAKEAMASVRDLTKETEILSKFNLSTPEGGQQAFDALIEFFRSNINDRFKGYSEGFKEGILDLIKQDFFDSNRMIQQGQSSRKIASLRSMSDN